MDAASLDQVFAWFDRDGNGFVDVPEFIEGIWCADRLAPHTHTHSSRSGSSPHGSYNLPLSGSVSKERASLIADSWTRLAGANADAVSLESVLAAAATAEGRKRGSGGALRALADRVEGSDVTRAQFESQFAVRDCPMPSVGLPIALAQPTHSCSSAR